MTTRANTGEQLHEVAAALKQDQRNYLHEVMQGQKRIEELEAELAKAHEYGYQYRQERNRAESELAALKAQEPIGWYTDDHLTDKSATTYDFSVAKRWKAKGWDVFPLYAAAPAQPQDNSCSEHPDAPHGFNRNASHTADRYVCDCEGWVPPAQPPSQGGEAVEVVASIAVDAEGVVRDFTLEPGLDRHPGGYTVTSLMTVAQHKRILAAQTGSAKGVSDETLPML